MQIVLKIKILHSENANFALKNCSKYTARILHSENANFALKTGDVLNKLSRIQRSENGNSALKKSKFCAQESKICTQEMEYFPMSSWVMESCFFPDFPHQFGQFHYAALKSKFRAKFRNRRILEGLICDGF